MDTPSRYTEYEVIDLLLDGVDQLISVIEQLMSVWEIFTRGEEGGSRGEVNRVIFNTETETTNDVIFVLSRFIEY